MEFLLGFLGAILAMSLFAGGVALGCWLKEKEFARRQKVTAEQLTEHEKRRLREEQEAWSALHNYSVEDAYNMAPIPKTSEKE